ncbi:MAG: hypothetical protein CVV44_11015 [Spirochaetae bacterium HGW-Spirochaetae-1]|jgi:hypothetical protein|nr:MAG: hypothetical protein CVV44_11015 [Spirochaetae bacterium HGW-Spirochaetae-1]
MQLKTVMLKIQIDIHASERAAERGVSIEEIEDVIHTGHPVPAKQGRSAKSKVFDFNRERNGKFYKHKCVEVYYLIENNIIITVTVYAFYGTWEHQNEHSI